MAAQFIESAYMVVKNTKQFTKACERWKRLPAADRRTEKQFRKYFLNKYNEFDAEQDTLHDAGIANAVLEEAIAKNEAKLTALKAHIVEQSAANDKYHAVIDTAMSVQTETQLTEDTTVMSQLTAMTVQHQKEMAALRTQMTQFMAATPGAPQQCYLANAGAPAPGRRTTKRHANCNACWTHGYDIHNNHTSENCKTPKLGHVRTHTGDNPAPGASKRGKQLSKWAE